MEENSGNSSCKVLCPDQLYCQKLMFVRSILWGECWELKSSHSFAYVLSQVAIPQGEMRFLPTCVALFPIFCSDNQSPVHTSLTWWLLHPGRHLLWITRFLTPGVSLLFWQMLFCPLWPNGTCVESFAFAQELPPSSVKLLQYLARKLDRVTSDMCEYCPTHC